jgi:hypothetical protein
MSFGRLNRKLEQNGRFTMKPHLTCTWPFDQPRDYATFTMRQIMDGSEPILLVSHDAGAHGWQCIGSSEVSMADAILVALEEVVEIDPTVLEVADLEPGWQAIRTTGGEAWARRKHRIQASGA